MSDSRHILVVHPEDESVLAVNDRNLPLTSYRGYTKIHLNELCSCVRSSLDLSFDIVLLRSECGVLGDGIIGKKALLIFDIPEDQLPNTSAQGKSWKWIPKAEVKDMRVEPAVQAVLDYLRKYSAHGLDTNSARLLPSSKPRWFDEASKWTKDVLSDAGYDVRSIVKTRNTSESAMLIATTQCGTKFYMKAVQPGRGNNEAILTAGLAKSMPNVFMPPLAVDEKSMFILMNDYGSPMPDEDDLAKTDPMLFRKILSAWAKIQIESISKEDELLQHDLPVIDLAGLKCRIEKVFKDPEWWIAQQEGMKEKERDRYEESEYKQRYVRYVEGLCGKISEYKVPLALVHGDLNAVNCISRDDSGLVFIDFASTCWSFPFVDAAGFAFVQGAERKDLDFYLEFWTAYESLDRLRELLALADKVCDVNAMLLSYRLYSNAEECDRLGYRKNIQFPVCRAFSKGFEV